MRDTENIIKKIFLLLGIIFLIAGGVLLTVGAVMNARIESCRRVSATVSDVIERIDRDAEGYSTRMYTPVYEYVDGGEMKSYTSHVSTSRRAEIGSQATLYISEDGRVYERSGAAIALFVGVVFAAVGAVLLILTVKMRKNSSEESKGLYL